jgi:cytoplasmic iron level regulating protein YaaA (DUF328/UPF0246 family)
MVYLKTLSNLRVYRVDAKLKNECGAIMEEFWQDKTEIIEEQIVSVPPFPP